MKPYTKILRDALGFMWDTKTFCVHHINHNHNDNRLDNLLLMPKRMHGKYHYCQQVVEASHICERDLSYDYLWNHDTFIEYINIKSDMASLHKAQYELMNYRSYIKDFNVNRFVNICFAPIYRKYL